MKPSDDCPIDALAGLLPMAARDRLADALDPAEIDTLAHLAKAGTGANSLRALASDLAYLEAWSRAATGAPLAWPASEASILRFIAHHLWDEGEREKNSDHGMPKVVAEALRIDGRLRASGPHAPATVRRRLALWSTLHRWQGVEGPFSSPSIRNALRLAIRAADRPRGRKSAQAITRDVLDQLLATCGRGRAVDLRDRALLLLAFGSGGRRRSEIARLRVDDIDEREPVPADPSAPDGLVLPVLALRLRRTKTASAESGESALVVGRPVEALRAWLEFSKIDGGPVFRRIDRWGAIGAAALDPQSVNAVIKSRCAAADLDPKQFSAHGLRSGYLTQAAREGVPLPEAMQQSQHRSLQQAARYYNEAQIARGRAARLA
ncbi:tyrosine-type recombinase/integrase [Methylocystis parvus]|uniref:Tyrosine-type recombinase/integrase n=1 Tax=Methylocystis parvus TaxID=134 RepID=A0A6B8MBA7_9HYPH|nr:tyrosine-type recombinase/integrase [Methylocystis parvus]QGM99976.1 tyrosine-type recombinase/integrase [Methylocystis parvus]WBK02207.1 tyrosine-type recombinase/integrase [Methylocystis parvus OBBP]